MRNKCKKCSTSLRPVSVEVYGDVVERGMEKFGWRCPRCGNIAYYDLSSSEITKYIWEHIYIAACESYKDALDLGLNSSRRPKVEQVLKKSW